MDSPAVRWGLTHSGENPDETVPRSRNLNEGSEQRRMVAQDDMATVPSIFQSMTGCATAQDVRDGVCYLLELRSVNHRYVKLSIKLPEQLQFLETDLERLIRQRIARGSVICTLRIRHEDDCAIRPVNVVALQRCVDQLSQVRLPAGVQPVVDLGTLATLPGICEPAEPDDQARTQYVDAVMALVNQGLDALIEMRRQEGQALLKELLGHCEIIRGLVSTVAGRAPAVVTEYHERLKSRVEMLTRGVKLELEADGLMREVAIYADRCDITEEVARLNCHLDQFRELCDRGRQVGRTLDFLTQEMLREANTIASKSNDTAITRNVVEIKGLIDRLREQVQNVE